MCVRHSTEEPWGPAVDVGSPVNGSWWVVHPEISPDGSTLYCNRGGGHGFTQVSIKPIVDFNGDAIVDILDLSAMIEYWGTDNKLYDIGAMPWGDGIVDVQDLLVLAEYLGPPTKIHLPIAHWALDETEGGWAFDSAGENHGMVMGAPVWRPEEGRVDGALELTGTTFIMASFVLNPADGPFGRDDSHSWQQGTIPDNHFIRANRNTHLLGQM